MRRWRHSTKELEGQIKMEFDKPFAGLDILTPKVLKDTVNQDDSLGGISDKEVAESSEILVTDELPMLPKEVYSWHGEHRAKREKNTNKKTINIDKIKTVSTEDKSSSTKKALIKPVSITSGNKLGNKNGFLVAASQQTENKINEQVLETLKNTKYPYKKRPWLLSEAEKTFYNYMLANLKYDIKIMIKIRLADIVDVNEAKTRDSRDLYKIACKHIDYVIVDKDINIICAVELDDFTHDTVEVQYRDKFIREVLQECGVPLFRVRTRVRNLTPDDLRYIEMCILEYFAPTCPLCGRPTEPKISHSSKNYGHKFYGCLGFYETGENKCDYTLDID